MRTQGIRGRLIFITGAAAIMVLSASISALIALSDIREELDTITQKELPAITAALELARIGERLRFQGAVLATAENPDSRLKQQQLIEEDTIALVSEVEKLSPSTPEGRIIISTIHATALKLKVNLIKLNAYLNQQSEFAQTLDWQRASILKTEDEIRQLLGPSILTVDGIIKKKNSAPSKIYQSAIDALGPLLSAERLVNDSIEELLLTVSAEQVSTITEAQQQFKRTRAELDLLMENLPLGLQAGLLVNLQTLQQQLSSVGVFRMRLYELAALENANRTMTQINEDSSQLKILVDELVLTTNDAIGQVTTRMGEAVVKNTLWFVVGSIAVVFLMTLFSWLWVVRPVGKNLIGVTRAMTLLAEGKREVQVPAMERNDEIGDLARAFTVFKDNMFHMDSLDRELSEKSGLLVTTFDNMNDGFTVFDAERKLIAWNPQFLNLYELSSDFVKVGRSIKDIHKLLGERGIHILTTLGEEIPIDKLSEYRETDTLRYEVKCPNGRILELRSNPVPTGGFVTIHMDITERLATEAQLRQAQKMEMVGQLTGGIAHDFNNILAVILGNLHILDRELQDDPVLKERAARALAAADRATRQIERLLAFSRRQKLEPESIDVNKLVTDMMDLLGYSLGSNIELITDFADDLPRVQVDPSQLENALMNLAVNARDALNNRGRIIFSTRKLSEPFVEVAVKDDGMGMPQEVANHVFEPFFTTKPSGKGSGLGLSMVYGFVTQSGGSIHISSQAHQGTTISLQLPVSLTDNKAISVDNNIPPGQGEAILVVDDDRDLLEITAGQVRELGYQVYIADGGESALERLRENPHIQLLYTDVVMPEPWNGVALAKEARLRNPEVLTLFTSAETSNLVEPGEKVLKKPVPKERLARNLSRILNPQALSTSASKT